MRELQAVALVDMMLECLQRPEQSVADSALQYFTCLDFVPMAERVRCSALSPNRASHEHSSMCAGMRATIISAGLLLRRLPSEAISVECNHQVASLMYADPHPVLDRNLTG